MPKHVVISDEKLQELEKAGGVKEETKQAKERYFKYFLDYITEVEDDHREILDIPDESLASYFGKLFFTLRVEKTFIKEGGTKETVDLLPKKKTAEFYKSMIKTSLMEKHGIDISDVFRFPTHSITFSSSVCRARSSHYC